MSSDRLDHLSKKGHAMAKRDITAAIGSLKDLLSGDDDFVRDALGGTSGMIWKRR